MDNQLKPVPYNSAADTGTASALSEQKIDRGFVAELKRLSQYIQAAKHDIAAIHPKDISTDHIPRATDELDAVVGATEEATNKIMDVCDDITRIAEEAPPQLKERLVNCTTQIFEACNFQDITGQRITKVVATLKHIDMKVAALLKALGDELGSPVDPATDSHKDDPASLLNGPQLPGHGINQDSIDQLLSQKQASVATGDSHE